MSGLFPTKPAAALGGGLLMRKGGARPGQRYDNEVTDVDPSRRRIVLNAQRVHDVSDFRPSAAAVDELADTTAVMVDTPVVPVQDDLVVAAGLVPDSEQTTAVRTPAAKRIAYTFRLDAERHAQLRFTAQHQHRSAQQVMLDALDRYLSVAVPFLLQDK